MEYPIIADELRHWIIELKKYIPDTVTSFYSLAKNSTQTNALDKKTKELICLALGVASHCDGCLAFHALELVKLGATEQEVAEALGIAIYLGGGPSLMYAAQAFEAFHQFKEKSA